MKVKNLRDAILTIERAIEHSHAQVVTLEELRKCLIHEQQKEMTPTNDMPPTLSVSQYELLTLKRLYHKALSEGREQFEFKGLQLLTSYAKYVIEYFEMTFSENK